MNAPRWQKARVLRAAGRHAGRTLWVEAASRLHNAPGGAAYGVFLAGVGWCEGDLIATNLRTADGAVSYFPLALLELLGEFAEHAPRMDD